MVFLEGAYCFLLLLHLFVIIIYLGYMLYHEFAKWGVFALMDLE